MNTQIVVVSTSAAADQGYRALADLAAIAEGANYRVIGGHMVQLLQHVYPVGTGTYRLTGDADAGVDHEVAAGGDLHHRLLERGYEATGGNSYRRRLVESDDVLSVDLLTEPEYGDKPLELGGRKFDTAPGLRLALSQEPIVLDVSVVLHAGQSLDFTTQVPGVDAALVLKALAWNARMTDRDVVDINTLLELVHTHRRFLEPWDLQHERRAATGTRLDAARALYRLVELSGVSQLSGIPGIGSSAQMAALIRRHIRDPRSPQAQLRRKQH